MTKLLSVEHAKSNILLHWKEAGFDIGKEPYASQVAKEFGQDLTDVPVAALYVFVDEYLALLRYTSFYFLSGCHPSSIERATLFYRLAVKQLNTLAAIRTLCLSGLDGNARYQLRLLHENSLLWVRLLYDHQALSDYQAAISPDLSNAFWHQYISKGKNEKWLKKELNDKNIFWLGGYETAINEMKLKISTTAHPSFFQSCLESIEDIQSFETGADSFILSPPTKASHLTLSMTILNAAIPFSIQPSPSYELNTSDLRTGVYLYPPYKDVIDWDAYNQKMREMFSRLFLASILFTEKLR